jgi:hypothetical protein
VSTVSGGGYIGGWLQAALANGRPSAIELKGEEPREIRFLRAYSNYLTPKLGLFSGDTWAAVGNSLRNLILNFTILSLSLLAPLYLPWLGAAIFWALVRNPESDADASVFGLRCQNGNRVSGIPVCYQSAAEKRTGFMFAPVRFDCGTHVIGAASRSEAAAIHRGRLARSRDCAEPTSWATLASTWNASVGIRGSGCTCRDVRSLTHETLWQARLRHARPLATWWSAIATNCTASHRGVVAPCVTARKALESFTSRRAARTRKTCSRHSRT